MMENVAPSERMTKQGVRDLNNYGPRVGQGAAEAAAAAVTAETTPETKGAGEPSPEVTSSVPVDEQSPTR